MIVRIAINKATVREIKQIKPRIQFCCCDYLRLNVALGSPDRVPGYTKTRHNLVFLISPRLALLFFCHLDMSISATST